MTGDVRDDKRRIKTTPWVPIGYREEERTCFPLLTWSGKHMWWAIRFIGRLNPEWSNRFAIFALSRWPRFRYHILVGQRPESGEQQ